MIHAKLPERICLILRSSVLVNGSCTSQSRFVSRIQERNHRAHALVASPSTPVESRQSYTPLGCWHCCLKAQSGEVHLFYFEHLGLPETLAKWRDCVVLVWLQHTQAGLCVIHGCTAACFPKMVSRMILRAVLTSTLQARHET